MKESGIYRLEFDLRAAMIVPEVGVLTGTVTIRASFHICDCDGTTKIVDNGNAASNTFSFTTVTPLTYSPQFRIISDIYTCINKNSIVIVSIDSIVSQIRIIASGERIVNITLNANDTLSRLNIEKQ